MHDSLSESRLAKNEVVFRQANEQVQKFMQAQVTDSKEKENKLHFYCECSNTDCRERIILTPTQYGRLHKNSSQFVMKPGHSVAEVERVIRSTSKYEVVEKYQTPPRSASELQPE
jgi:hypothetical protein